MIRRLDAKAILTVVALIIVFAFALWRSNRWRVPLAWSDWKALTSRRAPSNPEEGVYAMLDAARTGNSQAYLDCFSGALREQLAATAKEDSEARFRAYLISQNSAVQGVAVSVTDRPSPDEALVRLEYVYTDHNEMQNLRLKRERGQWKILSIDAAQPVKALVPFGTKATD